MSNTFVYFISGGGLIKIGMSRDPHERLATLNRSSPTPLELLTFFCGTFRAEQKLHDKFRDLRAHGEWFRPAPELIAMIDYVRKTGITALRNLAEIEGVNNAPIPPRKERTKRVLAVLRSAPRHPWRPREIAAKLQESDKQINAALKQLLDTRRITKLGPALYADIARGTDGKANAILG